MPTGRVDVGGPGARCPSCPLARAQAPPDVACPARWDWAGFCRKAAAEAGLPAGSRYWSDRCLEMAGRWVAPGTLVVRGHGTATGYGRMARYLTLALKAAGVPVAFDCIDVAPYKLDPYLGRLTLPGRHAGPCVQMSSPWAVNRPGNVLFSMFESSRLPADSVTTYNQARCVVVPCAWNVRVFRDSGVTAPIRVVPLGVDTAVYRPLGGPPAGEFVVLTVLAMLGGGHRKQLGDLAAAFAAALGDRPDARLVVKIAGDDELAPYAHPRISIDRGGYDDAGMAGLYRRASVYATLTSGEGWGMPGLEAMACGRPVVAPVHTGMAEYLTDECAYPVAYHAEPATGLYYAGNGDWFRCDGGSAVARLKAAYADYRSGGDALRRKGEAAARRAREFTWDRSAAGLLAVLREFGLAAHAGATEPAKPPVATSRIARPAIDPTVRDAVNACKDRGPEGGLKLLDSERSCCGGGPELTACAAGKGARPGRVTLRECLACRAEAIAGGRSPAVPARPAVAAIMVTMGQALMERALLSVAPHVSEVVVGIDMASPPDVEARLAALGLAHASWYRFPWSDDSAYGYNLATSRVSADWAMQVDDDETIENAGRLVELAASAPPEVGWFAFPRRHWRDLAATDEVAEWYPDYQWRLRRKACRVTGRIHVGVVGDWGTIRDDAVTIHHFNTALRTPEQFAGLHAKYERLLAMPPVPGTP